MLNYLIMDSIVSLITAFSPLVLALAPLFSLSKADEKDAELQKKAQSLALPTVGEALKKRRQLRIYNAGVYPYRRFITTITFDYGAALTAAGGYLYLSEVFTTASIYGPDHWVGWAFIAIGIVLLIGRGVYLKRQDQSISEAIAKKEPDPKEKRPITPPTDEKSPTGVDD